jgi:hypothetical protein
LINGEYIGDYFGGYVEGLGWKFSIFDGFSVSRLNKTIYI